MNLLRYEHRTEALASHGTFLRRVTSYSGIALVLAAVSLAHRLPHGLHMKDVPSDEADDSAAR